MSVIENLSRREFIQLGGKTSGALILGTALTGIGCSKPGGDLSGTSDGSLGVFVKIDPEGAVDIICHRAEMGQGIMTSVPQIIAEELCADWGRVTVTLGKADPRYGDQGTGGSASIRQYFAHIRQMGAVARDMLEEAAARTWSVRKSQVEAKNHKVVHKEEGLELGFGELASLAGSFKVPNPKKVKLKDPSEYTLIGSDVALAGLEKIVLGTAEYAQDFQLPGMLIASIERPPVVAGKVKSYDATEAKKVKGVVDVIQLKDRSLPVLVKPVSGVAVLADNTWAAMEGRKRLKVEWTHGENAVHNSEEYKEDLVKKVNQQARVIRQEGDAYAHDFDSERTLEATYTVPYHHHMSMETPAATAVFEGDVCRVWSGTQSPQWGKNLILGELGLDKEKDADKVEFNMTLMGGAFGRKGKNDFTLEAVELAKATGKPVKVVWTREDDVKHGFYHSIAANYFKAELTADNRSDNWIQRLASPPIDWIFNHEAKYIGDLGLSLGFADVPFDAKNMSFENAEVNTHVRTGWFRAVGNINNAFGLGCFVDELAAKAGIKTRQMWMNLLGEDRLFNPQKEGFKGYTHYDQVVRDDYLIDIARYKNVLNEVTEKSNAEAELPEGEGWGISVAYSFSAYAAAATKVRVTDGKVEVLEMHTALDCGLVITPDRVIAQMEGAMIMGLSLALESEITVQDGAIVQNNFHDYPVSRINQVPELHVHLITSDKPPGGVGEPGLPPVAPSIVNAIYHASGKRIRDLPVNKVMTV